MFDLEGVLTPHEFLLELAERAGKYEEVLREFRDGINGHRSWLESLRRRIEILRGTPRELAEEVASRVDFEPGAAELTRELKEAGWLIAIISGGFDLLKPALDRGGLSYDRFLSHRLLFEDGRLKDVELRFPDKGAAARSLKDELRPGFVVAVGDGWNDVPMLAEADLAIGFRPKPVLEGYVHMSASSIEELSRVLLSGRLEAAAERGEEAGQRGRRASLLEDAPAGEGAHVGRQLGHDAEPGRVQAAAQHLPTAPHDDVSRFDGELAPDYAPAHERYHLRVVPQLHDVPGGQVPHEPQEGAGGLRPPAPAPEAPDRADPCRLRAPDGSGHGGVAAEHPVAVAPHEDRVSPERLPGYPEPALQEGQELLQLVGLGGPRAS